MPPNTAGELCTRGDPVMLGYWDDDERTAEAIDRAGWLWSGDVATLDEDGYCNIVGRIKDMVIRGGENVYPREKRSFCSAIPTSRQCNGSACRTKNMARNCVRKSSSSPGASAGAEEIQSFCKGQIAHYKIPRYIKFVDNFPMTVTGKVQKFLMREETVKELGLSEQKTA